MLQSHANDDKFARYVAADVRSFEEELFEYLRDEVKNIIRTDGTWSVGSILHQDVAKSLIDSVLWWLFDGDPEEELLRLEQLNNPQHICGRVFKPGEPTYSCRDCAMDPTCVFCQQCFRNSEHRKHRHKAEVDAGGGMCDCGDVEAFFNFTRCSTHEKCFQESKNKTHKMHTSMGGGCCDCGDVEAWHQHHACELHSEVATEGMDTNQDAVRRLPEKIQQRAAKFFEVILIYIVDFLTNEKTTISDLKESLRPSEKSDCCVTMLYNDELHTFDFVIDTLKNALKCDDAAGAAYATIVDREGRSVVCIDDGMTCENVRGLVRTRPAPIFHFRTSEPLKTLVMHLNIVAHQELAILLIPRLTKIVQQSEGLRAIFCEVAMKDTIIAIPPVVGTSGSGRMSVVECLMRCDHELWKTPSNLYQQLLMYSLLLDAETKKQFGILFTRLYDVIMKGYIEGDHEHSNSIASLAVQLFTVPTVTRHLIVHEDVIGVLLQCFARHVCFDSDIDLAKWCTVVKLNSRVMKKAMRRAHYFFYDLKYILAILPNEWTPELRMKFLDGVKLFLHILMSMQGMDAVTRKSDRHILHEPDWETGVNMTIRLYPIIHHFILWFRTDVNLLFSVLKLCLQALEVINSDVNTGCMKTGTTTYNGKSYSCIDYDITKESVSTQYPVSRLTAAIIVELGKTGITWSDIEKNEQVAEFLNASSVKLNLLEYSLRCLSLHAQVNAGMWRRNGQALVSQLFYYKGYGFESCRLEGFERDIQMFQNPHKLLRVAFHSCYFHLIVICASIMDPNHFIALLLHKMKLIIYQPELSDYRLAILEDFFRLLINICGERFLPGIGEVTPLAHARRHILHILAAEPKPHSKISKQLPGSITEKLSWEDVLHEVADYQEPTNINSSGKYCLKQSVFNEFCPYSYHYSNANEETKAQQGILRRRKQTVLVPPKLPTFSPLFSGVPNLLCSDVLVEYLSQLLQQLTTENNELWSDRLAEKVFYLMSMAIVENEQQLESNPDTEFNFVKKATTGCESSILFLLKQLMVTEALHIHREKIRWLINKIERLSNQRHTSTSASSSVDPEHLTFDEQMKENDQVRNVRKRKAQERRDKLLTQMKTMQQNFLSQHPSLMADESGAAQMSQDPTPPSQIVKSPVCTELSWQLESLTEVEPVYTCILCQEDTSATEGSIVMPSLVQRSTILTRGPRNELTIDEFAPLFVNLSFPNAVHTSTCSHTMHYECFKQYRESVQNTNRRRSHSRYSRKGFDALKNEFLCPLCSRLSNTVIPVISHTFIAKERGLLNDNISSQSSQSISMIDSETDQSMPEATEAPPTMKDWVKTIEEILKPAKQDSQEFVMKFNVDVADMQTAMDDVETQDAVGYFGVGQESGVISDDQVLVTNIPMEQFVPQDPILDPDVNLNIDDESATSDGEPGLEETIAKLTKVNAMSVPEVSPLHAGQQAALDEFINTVQVIGYNGSVSEMNIPLTTWLSVATTIITSEMVSRLDGARVLEKSPIRIFSAMSGVIKAAFAMAASSSEEQLSVIRSHARTYLSALIVKEDTVDRTQNALMNSNIFSVFVNTWFSCSILRKSKQMSNHPLMKDNIEFEKNLIHLFTLANIVQIFLYLNVDELGPATATGSTSEAETMYQACTQVRESANLPPLAVTPEQMLSAVNECVRPFIRSVALFLHHVTKVPPPESSDYSDEQTALLKYLGLPKNLTELFDVGGKISLDPLIQKWCTHPEVCRLAASPPNYLTYPAVSQVPDFVPLSHDYSDLIGAAATFKCPKFASEDSVYPTMCLVCGVILCSQNYCCQQRLPGQDQQVGACTYHTHTCGAGTGLYLRVREAMIVFLNGTSRGCFLHAPYLDKYGETDKQLRRGNPLYLNQPRLLELRKLWLSHGIAERVTHEVEASHFGHALDWAHL